MTVDLQRFPGANTSLRVSLLLGLTILANGTSSGCGVETALLGASITAAQSGVTMVEKARLRSFELATFYDVEGAARRAGDRLALRLLNETVEDNRVWLYFRYGKNDKITVEIRYRTDSVTSIEIGVRNAGQRGMGSLYLRQIFDELREAGAYLDDWEHTADPGARPGGGGLD